MNTDKIYYISYEQAKDKLIQSCIDLLSDNQKEVFVYINRKIKERIEEGNIKFDILYNDIPFHSIIQVVDIFKLIGYKVDIIVHENEYREPIQKYTIKFWFL